jgi:hypothetical protein
MVAVAAPLAASTLWRGRTTEVAAVLVAPGPPPSLPVTPGWEPDWVGLRWFEYERTATGVRTVLRYEPTFPFQAELSVSVSDRPPDLAGETIQVGDHTATLATVVGGRYVIWPFGNAWIRVGANEQVSRDELLRYAASLIVRPLPMAMPFTVKALPETAELVLFSRFEQEYRQQPFSDALIYVSLVPRAALPPPTSTVDGLPLVIDADSITAYHMVDSDRAVRVRATAGWNLTPSQVASIAKGVQVTAVALTLGG